MRTRTMGRGLIVAACLSLAACGGGGDDGFGNGGPIQPGSGGPIGGGPPGSGGGGGGGGGGGSLAPGFWVGTTLVDGANQSFNTFALVTEEGDFYLTTNFSASDVLDFFGEDDGANTNFDADNVNTYNNFAPRPDSTIQGTVDPGVSFDGSINSGNISATFQLNYSDLYERSASLQKLQGVYSFSNGGDTMSVVVELDGDLTANLSNGCTLTGAVTVPNADRNYYRINGTITGCGVDNGGMRGLIFLDDSSGFSQNDRLILIGQTNTESTSVFVAGDK